jgi:phosphomevalonate kinase
VKIEVSAPGKLVLMGEYGVLFGAPALVMAVDRRARVELTSVQGDQWTLTAPGVAPRPVQLEVSPEGDVRWCDRELAERHFDLVDRLLGGLSGVEEMDFGSLASAAATLDTTPFFRTRNGECHKLGLGSSAALTVALTSALVGWSADGRMPAADRPWLQTLVTLHRRIQGGLGSGVDVAASVLGGAVEYRLGDDGSIATAAPVMLPGDLRFLSIWTGRAASTGSFLKRLEERRSIDRQAVERAIRGIVNVSQTGVDAVRNRSSIGFLDAVDRFWDALEGLGRVIDMPITSDEHRLLRRLACETAVRYKPSGAGGGDFGLAFDTDPERLAALATRAKGEDFEVVDLEPDPIGVAGDVVTI